MLKDLALYFKHLFVTVCLLISSQPLLGAPNVEGQWDPLMEWSIIPLHAILLPDGKLFSFGTDERGVQGAQFIYNIYDPSTNENKILPNTTGANVFCSNMAIDPNSGDVLIAGGDNYRVGGTQWSGRKDVIKLDYTDHSVRWSETGDMAYARWYGTMLTLNNGDLLMIGGRNEARDGSKVPEVYNTETGFRTLPGATIQDFSYAESGLRGTYYYVYAWQASDGDVWVIEAESEGTTSDIYRMDVTGAGAVEKVGKIPFETRNLSPGIMYDVDKVLITDVDGWAWSGDLSQPIPTWEKKFRIVDEDWSSRTVARTNATFVPMPDGKIALMGGTSSSGLLADSTYYAQYSILIWDPATNEYQFTAKQDLPRMYHSAAIMLADGRIWAGGGGAPGPYENDNAQVFNPPYLFNADGRRANRPEIIAAPKNSLAGNDIIINVNDATTIAKVTAIKSGSATHARTSDARVFTLDFDVINSTTIRIYTPQSNILSPGLWMLSIVDSNGVPSVSHLMGINMVDLVNVDPLGSQQTIYYDIEEEQITGAFSITVQARFDELESRSNQRIFDIGNDAGTSNIVLGQFSNSTDMLFAVYVDGQKYEIRAPNVIVEDEIADWKTVVLTDGTMELYKNDLLVAQGQGAVPENIERNNMLIGESHWPGDDRLQGMVRSLEIINNGDGGTDNGHQNHMPMIDNELSLLTGSVQEPAIASTQDSGTAEGYVRYFDMDETDTHSASFTPAANNYLGTFSLDDPTTTSTTTHGVVDWVFSVSTNQLQQLSAGEVRQQRYAITVADNNGAMNTIEVTITLAGRNSLPAIDASNSTLTATVLPTANDSSLVTRSGNIIFFDADNSDNHDVSVTPGNSGYVGSFTSTVSSQGNLNWQFSIGNDTLLSLNDVATQTYELTVTDSAGASSSTQVSIVLENSDASVLRIIAQTYAPAEINSQVTLSTQIEGGTGPFQFNWNFGDGSSETGFNSFNTTTHTYTQAGRYDVVLTVTDATGTEATAIRPISIFNTLTPSSPNRSSSIIFDDENQRIWNVNRDNRSVSVFDASTNTKLAEIIVGDVPRTLVRVGEEVWVTVQGGNEIVIINPDSLSIVDRITFDYGSQPYGIVSAPSAQEAYVTLSAKGQVAVINGADRAVTASISLGGTPQGLAINGDGTLLLVSRFITAPVSGEASLTPQPTQAEGGEINIIDLNTKTLSETLYLTADLGGETEVSAPGIPNYLAAPVISPDGLSAWVPSKEDNIFMGQQRSGTHLTFEHTVRAIASKVNLQTMTESLSSRLDFDDAGVASAASYAPYGNLLFVTLETSREVVVVDALAGRELFRFNTGLAPQGITLSLEGDRLYVHNFMQRSIGVYDLQPLMTEGEFDVPLITQLSTVSSEGLSPQVLKGKQLFYDAEDDRLARDGYLSCASCHRDGGHDGRVWDFSGSGEGLRNTTALNAKGGMAHGVLHWSGNFDEVQDFEAQIRELAGGTGLMNDADFNAGSRSQPLGDPKAGVSEDLDALAAYVTSLSKADQSPYRPNQDNLSARAQEGKRVFNQGNCGTCHSGNTFTSSNLQANPVDIGSLKPSSGSRSGALLTGIDVPTLVDLWDTAPYLHDGSAGTLEQAVAAHQDVTLSDGDMAALVAYLLEIDHLETEDTTQPTFNYALDSLTGGETHSGDWILGYRFSLAKPIQIESLGVLEQNGNGVLDNVGEAEIGLWNDNGELVLQASLAAGTSGQGDGYYTRVPAQVIQPGSYVIAATVQQNGEPILAATSATMANGLSYEAPMYNTGTSLIYPQWEAESSWQQGFFGPSFQFSSVDDATPASPQVSFVQPVNNTIISTSESLTINADATDADSEIIEVELLVGGTPFLRDTSAPFGWTVGNIPSGTYEIQLRATSADGETALSETLTVQAVDSVATRVNVSSPKDNSVYELGDTIPMSVVVVSDNNDVTSVEFYASPVGEDQIYLLHTASEAPYEYDIVNGPVGNYEVWAVVNTTDANVVKSEVVSVSIVAP